MREVPRTITLGPFTKGIDNLQPPQALPPDTLADAVNVDLPNTGRARRRQGITLSVAGDQCHSFWCDPEGSTPAYYVDYSTLYTLPQVGPLTKTAVLTGLTPGLRMSMDLSPLGVLYTNGQVIGLLNGSTATPLGYDKPSTQPLVVSASDGGSLPAGTYQTTFTWVDASGKESAADYPQRVTITDDTGIISISGFGAVPSYAAALRLYCSVNNGEILYHYNDYAPSTTSIAISVAPVGGGMQCTNLGLRAMPAGSIIRYWRGRVFVVVGSLVYFSQPYNYGLYDPTYNVIQFEEPVTLWEPVETGIYMSSDKTYFIEGGRSLEGPKLDPSSWHRNHIFPYRAIFGTSAQSEKETAVYWMSERGVIKGDDQGKAVNVQEEHIAMGPAQQGAGLYRSANGIRQYIASLSGFQGDALTASTWMEGVVTNEGLSL